MNNNLSNLVLEIIKGETTPEGKIKKISQFLRNKIKYKITIIGDPQKTLELGFGSCLDKAILFDELAKTAGLKSRYRITLIDMKKALIDLSSVNSKFFPEFLSFFPHFLNEVFLNGVWQKFDCSGDSDTDRIFYKNGLTIGEPGNYEFKKEYIKKELGAFNEISDVLKNPDIYYFFTQLKSDKRKFYKIAKFINLSFFKERNEKIKGLEKMRPLNEIINDLDNLVYKYGGFPQDIEITKDEVRGVYGIVGARYPIFIYLTIFFVLSRIITSVPFSNFVYFYLGYGFLANALIHFLVKKNEHSPGIKVAINASVLLFLLEMFIFALMIYFTMPFFITIFGSVLWFAVLGYLTYSSGGARGWAAGGVAVASIYTFLFSFVFISLVLFWEYTGIGASHLNIYGFFYQKPYYAMSFLALSFLYFLIHDANNLFIWRELKYKSKTLEERTKELEILKEQLDEKVKERTIELEKAKSELEESKTVLEIKVKARTRELEELTETLDEKVKERTVELQKRVNELERFHKVTVGRELKMIELKKELKKIKEEEKIKGRSI